MSEWVSVKDGLPPFNVMVWVAVPLWCIRRGGVKEFSPLYDIACLKDGSEKIWMSSDLSSYGLDEITSWMPIIPIPEPPS